LKNDYNAIDDLYDLIFHLLSFAYLYGDYAIPHHFMNTSSQAYLSVKKRDVAALRKFAARNWIDRELLSPGKQQELEEIYEMIVRKYGKQLREELSPLPTEFLTELAERAVRAGHFRDAHSAFKTLKILDKKVNELIGDAIQLLRSHEVVSGGSDDTTIQKIQQAVELVYQALRIKNPFGNQFQKLGTHLHYEDADQARKYAKYVELTLVKELLEFAIQFLIDDRSIADKVINALSTSKLKRIFLRQLAVRFSGGEERYARFVEKYRQAIERQKTATTEKEFLEVQKTLLGRGTGDNKHFQYLRELSLEHPISALLVSTQTTSGGEHYVAPIMLKSGSSLMDFLELA